MNGLLTKVIGAHPGDEVAEAVVKVDLMPESQIALGQGRISKGLEDITGLVWLAVNLEWMTDACFDTC